MRIQNINYSTNNNSVKSSKKQQNPSFGKLIIDERNYIPTYILKSVAKNKEIQKLTSIFHEKGNDLKLSYMETPLSYGVENALFIYVRDKKGHTEGVAASFREYIAKNTYFSDRVTIQERIDNLKDGFAQRAYNEYVTGETAFENVDRYRQEAQNIIDTFNKSLE